MECLENAKLKAREFFDSTRGIGVAKKAQERGRSRRDRAGGRDGLRRRNRRRGSVGTGATALSNLDRVLSTLGRASRRTSRAESAAIELAAYALLFIQATHRLDDLAEYVAIAKRPAAEVVRAVHAFSTREKALRWLRSSRKATQGTLLTIAGKLHAVVRTPGGEWLLVRTPSPQELERS